MRHASIGAENDVVVVAHVARISLSVTFSLHEPDPIGSSAGSMLTTEKSLAFISVRLTPRIAVPVVRRMSKVDSTVPSSLPELHPRSDAPRAKARIKAGAARRRNAGFMP